MARPDKLADNGLSYNLCLTSWLIVNLPCKEHVFKLMGTWMKLCEIEICRVVTDQLLWQFDKFGGTNIFDNLKGFFVLISGAPVDFVSGFKVMCSIASQRLYINLWISPNYTVYMYLLSLKGLYVRYILYAYIMLFKTTTKMET